MKEGFIYAIKLGLFELGFEIQYIGNNILRLDINGSQTITTQLIGSEPINESVHGSHGRNRISAIGYFKFKLPPKDKTPDFCIFAFNHPKKKKSECIVIPFNELIKRISKKNLITNDREVELQFWLMPDGDLLETTHIGAEGEWFFIAGMMAKDTDFDYTKFLNGWDRLKSIEHP